MIRIFILAFSLLLTIQAFCGEDKPPVTVMAAASLVDAFKEIGAQYEASEGKASFSFGASNTLRSQLENGARADVFASANKKEMDAAVKAGLCEASSVKIFVRNKLAIILPRNNPAGLKTPADLARPKLKIVIAADVVPVGKYTLEVLEKFQADPAYGAGFKEKVLANVVSREDNVKSVVAKVRLGEADAGLAYFSDFGGDARKDLALIEIPEDRNIIAEYPIAPLAKPLSAAGADAFVKRVLSPEGQAILERHGFIPVKN